MGWILQVSSGTGPIEVREFVAELARWIEGHCDEVGVLIESVVVQGELSTPRSVELRGSGETPVALASLEGTHQLIAPSARRGKRGRKRWFAGVRLFASDGESGETIELRDEEIEIHCARAGGPGGQHVNTTDSAVRILHKASGLSLRVASERSQHQNRRVAMQRLGQRLAELQRDRAAGGLRERRGNHYLLERGRARWTWARHPRSGELEPRASKERQ